jgi:hypothetical protein
MTKYDIPAVIIECMRGRDLWHADYYLNAAGRALSWMRIAADSIDDLAIQEHGGDEKVAHYHTYAGVSAARTALDALANWLRFVFVVPDEFLPPHRIDFAEKDFRKHIVRLQPQTTEQVAKLMRLAKEIDPLRQLAQHREGVQVVYGVLQFQDAWYGKGRWYLRSRSLQSVRSPKVQKELDVVLVLRRWAEEMEREIFELIRTIPASKLSGQEVRARS